jgi:hypothetical protein
MKRTRELQMRDEGKGCLPVILTLTHECVAKTFDSGSIFH